MARGSLFFSLAYVHGEGGEPLRRPNAPALALFDEDHVAGLYLHLLALNGHDPLAAYEIENPGAALVGLYLLPWLHADKRDLVLRLHPQYPRHELFGKTYPVFKVNELHPCLLRL